jgi:hypothetical protein
LKLLQAGKVALMKWDDNGGQSRKRFEMSLFDFLKNRFLVVSQVRGEIINNF